MANLDEIERLFAPIARAVESFAQTHSFQLEKCARGNDGWELTRPRAEGGSVMLLLLYEPTLGLGVGSVWQFPCLEMLRLYSHFRSVQACPLQAELVTGMLEVEMREIMAVRFGYWTHLQPLNTDNQHRFPGTQEQFT